MTKTTKTTARKPAAPKATAKPAPRTKAAAAKAPAKKTSAVSTTRAAAVAKGKATARAAFQPGERVRVITGYQGDKPILTKPLRIDEPAEGEWTPGSGWRLVAGFWREKANLVQA